MTVDNKLPSPETELAARIVRLKKEKGAVILAHYYTLPEVQRIADFTGDSLALSQQAARTDARIILFAGVHFMAETAKILSPDKKVLLPEPAAGCSLADSCRAEDFAEFLKSYPGHTVVSYVNTSVGVKALTDICCFCARPQSGQLHPRRDRPRYGRLGRCLRRARGIFAGKDS